MPRSQQSNAHLSMKKSFEGDIIEAFRAPGKVLGPHAGAEVPQKTRLLETMESDTRTIPEHNASNRGA